MTRITLPYGLKHLTVDLNVREDQVSVLEPPKLERMPQVLTLPESIGTPRLRDMVGPGMSIAIVTSDNTRPCPTAKMLPQIMEELGDAGVRDEDVVVVFALGIHRTQSPKEHARLVGEGMAKRLRCVDHDPECVTFLGTTSRGTPVEVFTTVVQADFRIALGVVQPHHFAGFSGGAKALVPGVCSRKAIEKNHSLMMLPGVGTGLLEGNPVWEDIEEGAALVGLDFIFNVVVDSERKVVASAAGHPVDAHRRLCMWLHDQIQEQIASPADIVLISPGGHPKDINFYQAQKALRNTEAAVRHGGVFILVAECSEGIGEARLKRWLVEYDTEEILRRFRQKFVLGGHIAAAIARILKKAEIYLVSEMDPELVRTCGLVPFRDLEEASRTAMKKVGEDARFIVMPEATGLLLSVRS
jgi:nickel-dependent lactate racemase